MWDGPTTFLAVLISTAAGGGLWLVVRQMWSFSSKVTDKVVADNMRLREILTATAAAKEATIAEKDATIESLRKRYAHATIERGAMRAALHQAGVEWKPEEWGIADNGH